MHPVDPVGGIGKIANEFILAAEKPLTQRQQCKTKSPAQKATNVVGQISIRTAVKHTLPKHLKALRLPAINIDHGVPMNINGISRRMNPEYEHEYQHQIPFQVLGQLVEKIPAVIHPDTEKIKNHVVG